MTPDVAASASATMPSRTESFWNLPNVLTLSRLVLAVVCFVLIEFQLHAGAAVVLVVAALTDWFDGYLARRMNLCSPLGRQLDPLVDKLLVCGLYIYLLGQPVTETGLHAWMVVVIVGRELIVQGLRSAIEGRGVAFGARWAGKVKTTIQFLSLLAILACIGRGWPRAVTLGRDLLTWAAVGLTIYSGVGYVWLGMRLMASAPPSAADDRPRHAG
jgi:CDP-diacylglycerol--glycerol-3-phosphate 3-phosphatidyltransferase